jgi:hypothetical protein
MKTANLIKKAKAVYVHVDGKNSMHCVNITKKEARHLVKTSDGDFQATVEDGYLYFGKSA